MRHNDYEMAFRKLAGRGAVIFALLASPLWGVDLSNAVIVTAPSMTTPETKAVQTLREEVEKRSQVRLSVQNTWPADSTPVIAVGRSASLRPLAASRMDRLDGAPAGAEGFRVQAVDGGIIVAGNDERGVLFGVGWLLRNLRMERGRILEAPDDLKTATAPKFPLRGHQLGFRPKVNSYDGFTVAMWEQYIRDLAVFGTNSIELIPPRSDDADQSPHFPLPKMEMMVEMSRLANEYGLDVWIWYPAMDKDYADPSTVEFALREWEEVYKRLPRIDYLFVPGGDPGHTQPVHMFNLLEKQTALLRKYHPRAQMWMSPQGFDAEWMEEFYGLIAKEPEWLGGIVYGPQVRVGIPELRAKVPKRYSIRRYPDITHSRHSQYPVPDWDWPFAITEGREGYNPRPTDQAVIFRAYDEYAIGSLTYSEGVNDDVNKIVWSALGWNPDADVTEILREFSRYFIGEQYRDSFAQGLLALERNWRGPLLTNTGVRTTFQMFQSMEREASPQVLLNWRFQQALYRAYYDEFLRRRLIYETAIEESALEALRDAERVGAATAVGAAEAILDRAVTEPAATDLRARIHELAEALYQSIRAQLSVEKYHAIATERGANLDTSDLPLNNRIYLKKRFAEIRAMQTEDEQLHALYETSNGTNPGPGGFYDDLGNLTNQPHLVRGPGFEKDPMFLESSLVSYGFRGLGRSRRFSMIEMPVSWWNHAEALFDAPLEMKYEGLDPQAAYKLRVVYAGEPSRVRIRLTAGDDLEIHPLMQRPMPFGPLEFDIPPQATRSGVLHLRWTKEPGLGGAGRGLQVAEVWLIRK
jgi:hypothetical protein